MSQEIFPPWKSHLHLSWTADRPRVGTPKSEGTFLPDKSTLARQFYHRDLPLTNPQDYPARGQESSLRWGANSPRAQEAPKIRLWIILKKEHVLKSHIIRWRQDGNLITREETGNWRQVSRARQGPLRPACGVTKTSNNAARSCRHTRGREG